MVELKKENGVLTGSVKCPHCKATQTFTEGEGSKALYKGEGTRQNTDTVTGEKKYERSILFDLEYKCEECGYTVPDHGELIEEIDSHDL